MSSLKITSWKSKHANIKKYHIKLSKLFSGKILMNMLDKLSLCFGMHENSVNLAKNCL